MIFESNLPAGFLALRREALVIAADLLAATGIRREGDRWLVTLSTGATLASPPAPAAAPFLLVAFTSATVAWTSLPLAPPSGAAATTRSTWATRGAPTHPNSRPCCGTRWKKQAESLIVCSLIASTSRKGFVAATKVAERLKSLLRFRDLLKVCSLIVM